MSSTIIAQERAGRMSFGDLLTSNKWVWSYVGAIVIYIVIMFASSDPVGTLMASFAFASFFMLVGMGQMFVITLGPGNIDLSIPYTIGLAGFVSMKLMNAMDANIAWGIIAGLLVGAAVGSFNYGLIKLVRIPPMVATLASGFIVQTFSIVFFRGLQIKPPSGLSSFAAAKLGIIPLLFVIVVIIAVAMHIVVTRSPYGRHIHAIGQNPKAAALAGINLISGRFATYVLCGTLAGLTGILLSAFGGGVTLGMGNEYLLNSIAVPVIGGTSIAGGNSNVPGILGASVLLLLVLYLLDIMGFTVGLRYIITGVVILAIMFASGERAGRT